MRFQENKILYFAYSKKAHKVTNVEHYHVAIWLNPSQRWKIVREFLHENYIIVVNSASSSNRGMYAGAYWCAAKEDPNIFNFNCLEKHPELSIVGKNKVAALAKKQKINQWRSWNTDP